VHDRAAAGHIVAEDRFADLGITDPRVARTVAESWHRRAELPSVYGRFDLRYDGTGPAKLLEYNADTPTSLVEAASPQWFWMEDRFPGADQWNSLHERLIDAWRKHTLDNGGGTGSTLWIEPAWKMLLSNKALLAILWELYPGHPNLLPAYLDGPRDLSSEGWVAKPLLGREGAGVTIHEPGSPRTLRDEPCCYQQLVPLPDFDGNRVVLGAWVVENESAGLGIRESSGLITDEYARFLPHVIL
jgi:glutathionylspermidine synthase